jgi:hypothetical protein
MLPVRITEVRKEIMCKSELSGHEWVEYGDVLRYEVKGPTGLLATCKRLDKAERLQEEWQQFYDKFFPNGLLWN